MKAVARPTRHQRMSTDDQRMLALDESGRYEFRWDAEAVSRKALATLANWVPLNPTREDAHLLVGVDEVEDAETGLASGVLCGLPKGLDKAVVRSWTKRPRPAPSRLTSSSSRRR